ncbi:glycoside hydrolase family 3 N-terminal domain-containing protein [Mycetocola sp. 2940]|uniref:glycoside hydrolase family 3 N-terminal domain-containing protein n=1 Tax=Mycetocola sp. 2940 TaxID=3156452 RepID=UPI00339776C5
MIRHPNRRRGRVAAVVLVLLTLAGCTLAPSTPTPPAPTPTATPKETTVPTASPAEIAAQERLALMTRTQKVASLLMLHLPGTDATALRSFVATHEVGGLIFMGDNIGGSAEETAALAEAASSDTRFPLLIGIDQEGGDVRRIRSDDGLSALTLKDLPAAETQQAFTVRSELLVRSGMSVNFGIIADVTDNPRSFIYRRALGTTPAAAGERVAAAVAGERGSVLSTIKHFPGHGAASGDSHTSVPSTDMSLEQWRAEDAVPFVQGIAAGAPVVMIGHLNYTAVDPVPASLSPVWHSILRDELGFDGIIITDDMLMLRNTGLPEFQNPSENAIRALAAGSTMLLFVLGSSPAVDGVDPTALIADIEAAVDTGRITEQQIDDAALRLLTARFHLGIDRDPLR